MRPSSLAVVCLFFVALASARPPIHWMVEYGLFPDPNGRHPGGGLLQDNYTRWWCYQTFPSGGRFIIETCHDQTCDPWLWLKRPYAAGRMDPPRNLTKGEKTSVMPWPGSQRVSGFGRLIVNDYDTFTRVCNVNGTGGQPQWKPPAVGPPPKTVSYSSMTVDVYGLDERAFSYPLRIQLAPGSRGQFDPSNYTYCFTGFNGFGQTTALPLELKFCRNFNKPVCTDWRKISPTGRGHFPKDTPAPPDWNGGSASLYYRNTTTAQFAFLGAAGPNFEMDYIC